MLGKAGIVILFFLLIWETATAQQFKNYTVDNGLPSSEVFQVVQDHKGFIWIATNQGVVRFDGYTFEQFTVLEGLPENTVLEIFDDYQNRIWFVSLSGKLSWYKNDSIHIYSHNEAIKKVKGQDYPIKKSFYVDSLENVFLGIYRNGLFRIDSSGEAKKLTSSRRHYPYIKKANESRVLYEFNKKPTRGVFYKESKKQEGLIDFSHETKAFRAISCLHNGYLLFSVKNILYVIKDGRLHYTHKFEDSIIWLSTGADGFLWVGLLNEGALALPTVHTINPEHHVLKNNSISSVEMDFEGGYWFTTLENGVFYTPSLRIKTLTTKDGLHNDVVKQIAIKNDTLWFASDQLSLFSFDFKKLSEHQFFNSNRNLKNRYFEFWNDTAVVGYWQDGQHSSTYFIHNFQVVDEINGYYKFISRLNKDTLMCLRDRRRVFVTNEGEIHKSHNQFSEIYSALKFEKDSLWMGTDKGLFKTNLRTWKTKSIYRHNLLRQRINVLYKDTADRIWIGTKGAGLLYFVNNKVKQVKMKNGLPSNSINAIKRRGNELWLATNKGLSRLIIVEDTLAKNEIVNISTGHGLVSNEVYDIELSKDKVIAATVDGISYFNTPEQIPNTPVYISKIRIQGNDTSLHNHYNFEHDQNSIEITFTGINYQRNKSLRYRYKLRNIDKTWQTTEDRTIRFSSLSPGSYKFLVKAVNSYGRESAKAAQFSFTIKKPYYETIWFRIVVILGALLIVFLVFYAIFRLKINELRKRAEMEKQLNRYRQQALSAQMNPHFIYNSLNSVQSYILRNERIESSEYLSRFGNLMRRMLNNSQKLTISLEEEIEALKLYVDMELMRFRNNFVFNIQIAGNILPERIFVPPMIIQPYVENAIHHGLRLKDGDKKLDVIIDKTKKGIRIVIQDNGIGRKKAAELQKDKHKIYKSYGTEITRKRLMLYNELYKNEVSITTTDLTTGKQEGEGTKVEIVVSEALYNHQQPNRTNKTS